MMKEFIELLKKLISTRYADWNGWKETENYVEFVYVQHSTIHFRKYKNGVGVYSILTKTRLDSTYEFSSEQFPSLRKEMEEIYSVINSRFIYPDAYLYREWKEVI